MCFGCLKEPSHWDGSFEYPQHMFWLRNKKNHLQLRTLIWDLSVTNASIEGSDETVPGSSEFKLLPVTVNTKISRGLSGRVLDWRPRGCRFDPHRRHCVVVLE